MVLFATYEQWKESRLDELMESPEGKSLPCIECNGDGETYCGHCESLFGCKECDCMGCIEIYALSRSEVEALYKPEASAYLDDMAKTFTELSIRLDEPLIELITPFMKYFNVNKGNMGK